MNRQNLNIPSDQQINKWEDEMKQNGFIEKINPILSYIKILDESSYPELVSKLLTLLALSKIGQNGETDSLSLAWMQKAKRLDPDNERAREFLAQFEWKEKKNILNTLTFPPIRETDNRPAKKKTAEEYIEICHRFLEEAEKELELLEKGLKSAKTFQDRTLIEVYENLIETLGQAMEQTGGLLKATIGYEESITGVFYTSTHFQEMKVYLEKLASLKEKWNEQFKEEIETVEESSLDELNKMIGLETVKRRVSDFYQFLKYQKKRKALGFKTKDALSLNMILTGNPGTGKTTLARLFAKIYHELGVLPREEVIEADRSQLVGGFVGQTEENVRKVVERALGGVLFIDEAYSLKREGQTGNDYGQTAIDTLVSLMTGSEYGGKFAVIMAGYPEEMRQFLDANPGLRSRFPLSNHFHLEDYSRDELLEIAEQIAKDNDYILTKEASVELGKRIENERVDDTFGNARTVKNIVLDAIFKKGSQTDDKAHILQYTMLEEEDFRVAETTSGESPKEKLNQLVGLEEVKEEVKTLVSFVEMQQLRRERGLPVVPIQLHSVFSGNPGTGKTTVAKIYAELLKKCGMLKRGHLIVASRADFVAGYVGQTAIKTKKKIREALGGVLFIDEAYSLLSESSGDFGKEVVDTLVDEMTKHNENLVIVLAGYPKEMERLLESNPGLKSRFKKFIHFHDYNMVELLEIMTSYASKFEYTLSEDAKEFIRSVLSETTIHGNGRFATNLIDEAIQSQALRFMSNKEMADTAEAHSVIIREDIERAIDKIRKGV